MSAGRLRAWWAEGHPLVSRWTHTDDGQLTWVGRAVNAYYRRTQWLRPSFWAYIWRAPEHYYPRAPRGQRWRREWRKLDPWTVRWCRLRGHPAGRIFYSSGLEPDNRCANCLEDLG